MWLLGVLDFTVLTDGLVTAVEGAVTSALPVLAVLIAAFLTVKVIRHFLRA
jgi:hypothetical protein